MNQMIIWFNMLKSTVDNFPKFFIRCAWIGILMIFLNRFSRVLSSFLEDFTKKSYYVWKFVLFNTILNHTKWIRTKGDSLYIYHFKYRHNFCLFISGCSHYGRVYYMQTVDTDGKKEHPGRGMNITCKTLYFRRVHALLSKFYPNKSWWNLDKVSF